MAFHIFLHVDFLPWHKDKKNIRIYFLLFANLKIIQKLVFMSSITPGDNDQTFVTPAWSPEHPRKCFPPQDPFFQQEYQVWISWGQPKAGSLVLGMTLGKQQGGTAAFIKPGSLLNQSLFNKLRLCKAIPGGRVVTGEGGLSSSNCCHQTFPAIPEIPAESMSFPTQFLELIDQSIPPALSHHLWDQLSCSNLALVHSKVNLLQIFFFFLLYFPNDQNFKVVVPWVWCDSRSKQENRKCY